MYLPFARQRGIVKLLAILRGFFAAQPQADDGVGFLG
jgi:hypothetical protein